MVVATEALSASWKRPALSVPGLNGFERQSRHR